MVTRLASYGIAFLVSGCLATGAWGQSFGSAAGDSNANSGAFSSRRAPLAGETVPAAPSAAYGGSGAGAPASPYAATPASSIARLPSTGSPPENSPVLAAPGLRANWNTPSGLPGGIDLSGNPAPSANPNDALRLPFESAASTRIAQGPPGGRYIDLDVLPDSRRADWWFEDDAWDWQLLPTQLIYRAYLAGAKESRFSTEHVYNQNDGWLWEPTLGTHVGILRYGDHDPLLPQGWQFDVEGSAQARLDVPSDVDVRSADFRAGMLLTRGYGRWQTKFGYYHLSSHLGDEFLLDNPTYPRLNYVRDALVLGQSLQLGMTRLYGEATWAFNCEYAEAWEFQFGVDIAPPVPTGIYGAPFFAINGYLRQEVDFGGNLSVQAGWAWRGDEANRLLRLGISYYNGKSSQFSFYDDFEQKLGFGLWYDF